ncbi:MAG: hypothetical protein WA821_15525 [Anaerolineales bacterium]
MNTPVPNNPYVGPRPIKKGEPFFGREREIRSLAALLMAERIVLLHSPSGAGKSSLIQAGLMPRMVERFSVFPLVRVNLEAPPEARGVAGLNRYALSTLLSLEEGLPPEKRLPLMELAALTLDAYLEKRALPDGALENCLLIFDQFEEVLTVSPTDAPAKQQFFEQLGEALQNRRRWALFSMREDYMGGLAPYTRAIPNRLNVTFRLGLLGPEAARPAIQQPAKNAGVDFKDEAAQKLVDDLRCIQTQQPDGSFVSEAGPNVEPVQLQVVCYNLWQSGAADDGVIDESDLQRVGSVDQALASFYANSVKSVSASSPLDERVLRQWFNERLITPEGIRSQVLKGAETTEGLPNSALRLLEDTHLVRGETRAGKTWYELAHDRLVKPVRQDNTAWFERNLKLFQRQAVLWNQQGHGEGLLLRGTEMLTAEKDAKSLRLTPDESAFLEACRSLQKRAQRDRRQRQFIIAGLVASLVLLIVAVFFGISANAASQNAEKQAAAARTAEANAKQNANAAATAEGKAVLSANAASTSQANAETEKQKAVEQASVARAGELVSLAVNARDKNFLVSMLLGVEAFRTKNTYQSRGVLLDNTQTNPPLRQFLNGHTDLVSSLAFSPDGKMLASGSKDGAIILWNIEKGQPIGQLPTGDAGSINSLAFSPDGKTLASGGCGEKVESSHASCPEGNVILWDVATRQPVGQPLKGHTDTVTNIAFSPDGKTLASASTEDFTIILWDVSTARNASVATGQVNGRVLTAGHTAGVFGVAFSPDGKMLASGSSGDSAIILWDVATGQPIGQPLMQSKNSAVSKLVFSSDGKTLASSSDESVIILWDVATHKPIGQPVKGPASLGSLAFSPDGKTLASLNDKTIILWDAATGQPIGQPLIIDHDDNGIYSTAFSADGKTLASGSSNGAIILWDVATPLKARVPTARKARVAAALDTSLAAGQPIGRLLVGHTDRVNSVAFSPDGKTLASGSDDNTIILWDISTMLTSVSAVQPSNQLLKGQTSNVYRVVFSPDGKTLASGIGGVDRAIILWDMATHQPIGQPFKGHLLFLYTFSPDGKTLASDSDEKVIILWDVATRQPLGQPFKGHTSYIDSIAFSPDGKTLASSSCARDNSFGACLDGEVFLWDVTTRQSIVRLLTGQTGRVNNVTFSPNGKTLALSISNDNSNTILLWDVSAMLNTSVSTVLNTSAVMSQSTGQLKGHTDTVSDIAFSPDGKMLASGSYDKTVILWDIATGQPIGQPLKGHTDSVNSVAFSPDGKTLASGSSDNTIILWDLDPQFWVEKTCQRVGRNFTRAEWAQYGFTEPYRATCPQWPLEAEATPTPAP